MPRTVIALVRHGVYLQPKDVPSAHLPHPLDAMGREQALQGAESILEFARSEKLVPMPDIDSSPLLRAWESATLIAERLQFMRGMQFRVREFEALCERSLGSAANLTTREIEAVVDRDPRYPALPPKWKQQSELKLPLPGAESLMEAGRRVARHIESEIERLNATEKGDLLKIFVGHGAAFRHAAVHLGLWSSADAGRHSMFHGVPVYLERKPNGDWTHVAGEWKPRGAQRD